MKTALILLVFFLQNATFAQDKFKARITYYSGTQTASGKKPVQGETVAAEKRFKFGQKLHIPELKKIVGDDTFTVHDRGPWVESRKASKGKLPVIDVYVSSRAQAKKLGLLKNNIFTVIKK